MVGRRILHYEILGRLGGGGNGEVYLAHDQKLGRDVAIKRLAADRLLDHDRLEQEAKVLAALSHPNIVTVYAIESVDDEQFLVMELVEGTPLQRLIPDEGMDADMVPMIGIQLAEAVAAAHEAGVLHRDLKPANVLVDDRGRIKILDFGLAEVGADTAEDEDETISRVASISGTVAYLAPELILGKRATVASDVFAVGVVLYQMATGRKPFQADSSVELLATIVNEPIPRITHLVPGFPRGLARIVETALAKIPEQRQGSAAELADQLRDHLEGGRPWRKPLLRGLAGIAVLAAVGGLGWLMGADLGRQEPNPTTSDSISSPEERQRVVVLPFVNLGQTDQAYFAVGVTEELTVRLAAVGGLKVLSRSSAAVSTSSASALSPSGPVELDPQEVGRRLGVDFVLEGSVQWAGSSPPADAERVRVSTRLIRVSDGSLAWSGRYDRVLEDIFSVQTEIAEAVISQLGVAIFPAEQQRLTRRATQDLAAYQTYLQAIEYRHQPVLQDPQRPVRLLEEAVRRDPKFFLAWAELAHAHAHLHHFGIDRSAYRRRLAREAVDQALALAPDSPEVHLAHGYVCYWAERNYPAAEAALEKAAAGLPNEARLFEAQGYILRRLGRFEQSLVKMRQARDLDPLSDRYDRAMAVTSYYLRRYGEAAEHLARAVELAPTEPFNRILRINLFWLVGDLAGARSILDSMEAETGDRTVSQPVLALLVTQDVYEGRLERGLARLAASEVDVFRWTVRLYPKALFQAKLSYLAGRSEDERRFAAEALRQVDDLLITRSEDPRLHGARALALASLGRADEALAAIGQSLELLPIEKDAVNAPYRWLEAAQVDVRLGRHDEAMVWLRRLLSAPSEYSAAWLQLDPWFEPLTRHPEFAELLAAEETGKR